MDSRQDRLNMLRETSNEIFYRPKLRNMLMEQNCQGVHHIDVNYIYAGLFSKLYILVNFSQWCCIWVR